jgi:cytochrome c553
MNKGFVLSVIILLIVFLIQCTSSTTTIPDKSSVPATASTNGFENQVKWGEHLVTVGGCQDCHSPKKMTPTGPDIDSSVMLAGYMGGSPEADVNRKEMQTKGLAVTRDLTAWIGPWGVSYAANLTSDVTGIGNWKEEQFMFALRQGKLKGLPSSRDLLPPMPWQMYKNFTDDEIKAIFAYLKSTKPIKNVVPAPLPPATK